jgi:hypothetical protein
MLAASGKCIIATTRLTIEAEKRHKSQAIAEVGYEKVRKTSLLVFLHS